MNRLTDLPAWITRERFPTFVAALEGWARDGSPLAKTPDPISGEQFREPYRLPADREIVLGRGLDCSVCRINPQIQVNHCVIVRDGKAPECWIADCRSPTGTWVNRSAVAVSRVESGDLIQLGPYAFTLNGTDGFLVPVAGIPGAEVHFENLDVGRLRVERLTIPAGRFVAVTGPSGAGKSTLLKALAGLPEFSGKGDVWVDGHSVDQHRGWYRSILGYLSQDAILHDELSPLHALKINQRLRRRAAASERGPKAIAAGGVATQLVYLLKREASLGLHRWLGPAAPGRRRASLRDRLVRGVQSLRRTMTTPLVLVPVLFAVALHLTLTGSQKREMLGFFAVLASLWMGSSLSLLSIVGERSIFDHESFLYLRIGPYVLAKFLWLGIVSVCQTSLFFGILWGLRALSEQETPLFYGNGWVFLVLVGQGWAGVALGLLISALAGRNKETATCSCPS